MAYIICCQGPVPQKAFFAIYSQKATDNGIFPFKWVYGQNLAETTNLKLRDPKSFIEYAPIFAKKVLQCCSQVGYGQICPTFFAKLFRDARLDRSYELILNRKRRTAKSLYVCLDFSWWQMIHFQPFKFIFVIFTTFYWLKFQNSVGFNSDCQRRRHLWSSGLKVVSSNHVPNICWIILLCDRVTFCEKQVRTNSFINDPSQAGNRPLTWM